MADSGADSRVPLVIWSATGTIFCDHIRKKGPCRLLLQDLPKKVADRLCRGLDCLKIGSV